MDADRILELTRAYLVDEAPKNSESHALSLMRKHVRTWLPGIRLLLAYSDGAAGHPCGATFYEDPHFFLHRACIPLADVDFMAQTTMFSQRGCTTGRFT